MGFCIPACELPLIAKANDGSEAISKSWGNHSFFKDCNRSANSVCISL